MGSLDRKRLASIIGLPNFQRISGLFPGEDYDEVKLRRCTAHNECINFHKDYAQMTMQVPLNDEDAYSGGSLIYATAKGLTTPPRPAGSVTIHDNQIVHGVTQMEAGVRYALFLL